MLPELNKLYRLITHAVRSKTISEEEQERAHEINDSLLQYILNEPNIAKQKTYFKRAVEGYAEIFDRISVELNMTEMSSNIAERIEECTDIRYIVSRGFVNMISECAIQNSLFVDKELKQDISHFPTANNFKEYCAFCVYEELITGKNRKEFTDIIDHILDRKDPKEETMPNENMDIIDAFYVYLKTTPANKPNTCTSKVLAPSLVSFFYDDDEREKVVAALNNCKDSRATCKLIAKFLKINTLKLSDIQSPVFIEAIIPLLGYETTEEALKKAISRDKEIGVS